MLVLVMLLVTVDDTVVVQDHVGFACDRVMLEVADSVLVRDLVSDSRMVVDSLYVGVLRSKEKESVLVVVSDAVKVAVNVGTLDFESVSGLAHTAPP